MNKNEIDKIERLVRTRRTTGCDTDGSEYWEIMYPPHGRLQVTFGMDKDGNDKMVIWNKVPVTKMKWVELANFDDIPAKKGGRWTGEIYTIEEK